MTVSSLAPTNARRDNLEGFWSQVYGTSHAIVWVDSFFENVPTHLFEKRALADGEKESNTVLHFKPNPPEPMIVACVWSHWSGNEGPELDSFAAITDEPPPEIAETGHQLTCSTISEEAKRCACRFGRWAWRAATTAVSLFNETGSRFS